LVYVADVLMAMITEYLGLRIMVDYDAQGRCVLARGEDGQAEVRLRYLADERVTVVTRGDGGRWTYFYDAQGQVTKIIDPYGGVRVFKHDNQGRLTEEVDPNGAATRVLYEPAGAPVWRVSPLGYYLPVTAAPGEDAGPTYQVGETPLEWEYGRLINGPGITPPESSDPVFGRLPPFAYVLVQTRAADPEGTSPPAGAEEPAGDGYRVFDDFGLLVREFGPAGRPRSWSYDPVGNVHRYHDHDGGTYTQEFTSWNLLARQTDPNGHAIALRYNTSQFVTAVTDPGGAKSEYAYDLKDRPVRVYRHGVLKEEYVYDLADNLVEKRDGNGNVLLRLEVGPRNLTTVRRLASGETHSFAYDERGRYTRAATDTTETLFDHDGEGRRVLDERDGKGVRHRFDYLGLEQTTVLGKFVTRYERPSGDTLLIRDPGGQTQALCFPGNGLVVKSLSNVWVEVSQYDAAGRCLLKAAARRETSDHPWSRTYRYSGEGDLVESVDSERGTYRYRYDPGHRLVAAEAPGGKVQTFAYDPAGNLLSQPGLADVRMREGNRLEAANGERFTFNERNHVAAREGPGGVTRYAYDSRDFLTGCAAGGVSWRAEYDPLGRRTSKAWGDKRVDYYWDGDRLAAEVNQDGRVRVYVYPDELAVVPLLFLEYESLDADPASGKRYFLFCDQIGTPVRVKDDAGANVWGARVEPYGKAHVDPRTRIEVPLRFPGHSFDAELNLHYNRFRYYSPDLGRYLQSDPWGLGGGVNLYAYPASPLARVDVLGTCAAENRRSRTTEELERLLAVLLAPVRLKPGENLEDVAKAKAWELINTLTNNERGPNLTARLDRKTNKVYFALNASTVPEKFYKTPAGKKRAALINRVARGDPTLPDKVKDYNKYDKNFVHGEQFTENAMLKDRPGAKPSRSSQVANFSLRGADKGKLRPMCPYCQQMHAGTPEVTPPEGFTPRQGP
jgi:RHS repeat-associated protein